MGPWAKHIWLDTMILNSINALQHTLEKKRCVSAVIAVNARL